MNPVQPVAETLLECARAGLASVGAVPERVCVTFGEIQYDDCECGQLVVAVRRVYPFRDFPAPLEDAIVCGGVLTAADITVSYTRCVPGDEPTCAELAESATTVYEETWAMWTEVMCCLQSMNGVDGHESIVQQGTYVGPGGICGGMEIDLTISLNDLCRCGDG